MVITINLICLLIAFILFVLSAIGIPSTRVNLQSAGLAFWVLALLLGGIR